MGLAAIIVELLVMIMDPISHSFSFVFCVQIGHISVFHGSHFLQRTTKNNEIHLYAHDIVVTDFLFT